MAGLGLTFNKLVLKSCTSVTCIVTGCGCGWGCECASRILPVMRMSCTRTHPRPSVTDKPQLMSSICWQWPCNSLWDRMTVCHGETFSSRERNNERWENRNIIAMAVSDMSLWSSGANMLAENRQINDYLFANQESKFVLVHKNTLHTLKYLMVLSSTWPIEALVLVF